MDAFARCSGTRQIGTPASAHASTVAMTSSEVFRRITTALEQAGVAYMLSGSFASAYHGAPRSTQDIDIVIAANPEQLRTFVQSLPSGEYYADLDAALEAHTRQSLFNVIDLATGLEDRPNHSQIPRLQPGGVRPSPISQRAGPSSFCGERRGCSHCETGMVKAGAIATANRRCGGHIEVTMGSAGRVLPVKMDLRGRLETGME